MFEHFKGTGGYAGLYLMMVFGISLLTMLLAWLLTALGVGPAMKIAGGVVFAVFWIVGFIVMQRFLSIEQRRPTLFEANMVGVKSVLYFLGFVLAVALAVAICAGLVKVISSLGGASGAERGPGGAGGPGAAGRGSNGEGPNQQALGALMGVLGALFILYVAPFLNMALLSRLFPSNSSKTEMT